MIIRKRKQKNVLAKLYELLWNCAGSYNFVDVLLLLNELFILRCSEECFLAMLISKICMGMGVCVWRPFRLLSNFGSETKAQKIMNG